MDTIFAPLACCLLVLSLPAAQMENQNLATIPPSPGLNTVLETTESAPSISTAHVPIISDLTEHTTRNTSTEVDDGQFSTAFTTESTSQDQTSQAASTLTTLTNPTQTSTPTPAATILTSHAIHTTSYTSPPDLSIATENPPYNHSAATESVHTTTQGVRLNVSEKSLTIIFSAVLVLFVVALVIIMLHKCKHKIQYLHQPLDTDDTGGYMEDDDTLVISGGLYDGHPIYDNVPPVPADQSQFHLEFLH